MTAQCDPEVLAMKGGGRKSPARLVAYGHSAVDPKVMGLGGATGPILTVNSIAELQRANGRYGLTTLCFGGAQGIAATFGRM